MSYISCALRAAAPRRLPAPWRSPRPFSSTAGPPAEKNVPYQKTLKEEGARITGPSRPLPPSAEVVVVGGGSLGCQTTYHLAKLGVTSVVLLERDRLTSGTTWHTAGEIAGSGSGPGGVYKGPHSWGRVDGAHPRHGWVLGVLGGLGLIVGNFRVLLFHLAQLSIRKTHPIFYLSIYF